MTTKVQIKYISTQIQMEVNMYIKHQQKCIMTYIYIYIHVGVSLRAGLKII